MENDLSRQEQLNIDYAIRLSAEQVQPESFNINTYYTQMITAYGNGFFDTDSIDQEGSIYDAASFNEFIDDIRNNIDKIYGYDFSKDNPRAAQEFLENCDMIKLKYTTTLKLTSPEEKKPTLMQLKNNLLEELGIYEVFVEKCNATNVANIEERVLEYAKYLSLQKDTQNLTTQQSQFFTTPNSSNNQISTKISYQQQDFNEFLRTFIQTIEDGADYSKKEEMKNHFFTLNSGSKEEELPLITELSIENIDSIENAETLYPKEVIIRRAALNGTEGEVLATIADPFNKCQYSITNESNDEGKKIKNILENIKSDNSHQLLALETNNAGFVFESCDTKISIKPSRNPSFFSIPIKRAKYINGQAIKNDKAIKFNDAFDIGEQNFKLTDIIMHDGEGSESGHYYTISKREIELTNGQKHIVFLQHNDAETQCFMKFGSEIRCIDIKDVESELNNYNESLKLSENSSLKFATLADIKESQKIEQNFTNIIYQKEIPSSEINDAYKGLKNYGNSCYINSFLAVVAGMNDGSEKQLLLTQLKTNGIELVNNKFSNLHEGTNIEDLVGILRINQGENQIVIYEDKSGQINTPENQKVKKKIFEGKPKTTIEPSFFSRICDFFASLDPFSSCRGN